MDIRYKLYPYPVLAPFSDDYVGSSFEAISEVKKEGYNLSFSFVTLLNNKELLKLISESKAAVTFHLECAQTGFRTVITTQETELERIFPENRICGRLKICPFIVAMQDISDYVSTSFNEDYKGYKFQIDAGCVLAVGEQINFDIDKDRNELANTKSIFSIIKDLDPNATDMSVDLTTKKIVIKLPENDWNRYKNLSLTSEIQDVLNSMIIIPALIYTLNKINSSQERFVDFGSNNWYKSIKKAMSKHFNKDIDDVDLESTEIFMYAQKLINSPISGALKYLYVEPSSYEEDDE